MNEPIKVTKKITGFKVLTKQEEVVTPEETPTLEPTDKIEISTKVTEVIDEAALAYLSKAKAELKRPRKLSSETYRLKPPHYEHALYIHISDIIYEDRKYPFELFFSCKNPENIMWVSTITLLLSETFREAILGTNNLTKVINNLKEVCDASGGYFAGIGEKKKHVGSIVAEIGYILENHVKECHIWNYSNSSHERPATEAEKDAVELPYKEPVVEGYPANATICKLCGVKAVVILDNCATCLECMDSKCG
jgi:hypothetical protein